jgi:signal transduction histidine kinase
VDAAWGADHDPGLPPAELDVPLDGDSIAARVARTGRAARFDDDASATGPLAELGRGRHGIRAALGMPIVVDGRLWGVMVCSSTRPGSLARDVEARVAQFTELAATAISNIEARTELAASRARIVEAADAERRRVVRDLHDGAQQRLVHTSVTLKLARRALAPGDAAAALIDEALEQADDAMTALRELVHGILPAALTSGGLRAGVNALASRMPVPIETEVEVGRLAPEIEATAYFVIAEALTNVAKHAAAQHAEVCARIENGNLQLQIRDDGSGGANADGNGFVGLADRLAVLDGRLRIESAAGSGTLVAATIPLPSREHA